MTRRRKGRVLPSRARTRRAVRRDKQTMRKLRGIFATWHRRN